MTDERLQRAVAEVRRAGLMRELASTLMSELSLAGVAIEHGCMAPVRVCYRAQCCGRQGRGPCIECEKVITPGAAMCAPCSNAQRAPAAVEHDPKTCIACLMSPIRCPIMEGGCGRSFCDAHLVGHEGPLWMCPRCWERRSMRVARALAGPR